MNQVWMGLLILGGLLISCGHTSKPHVKSDPRLCHEAGFDVIMGEVYKCEFVDGTYNCYRTPGKPEVCQEVED